MYIFLLCKVCIIRKCTLHTNIGYKLPTFGEYMSAVGFLCALRAQGWGKTSSWVDNFPADNFLGGTTSPRTKSWGQRPQPPVFSSDICAKSESNPKCLSKSLDKTNPNKCVITTKRDSRQKCALFQLGN